MKGKGISTADTFHIGFFCKDTQGYKSLTTLRIGKWVGLAIPLAFVSTYAFKTPATSIPEAQCELEAAQSIQTKTSQRRASLVL